MIAEKCNIESLSGFSFVKIFFIAVFFLSVTSCVEKPAVRYDRAYQPVRTNPQQYYNQVPPNSYGGYYYQQPNSRAYSNPYDVPVNQYQPYDSDYHYVAPQGYNSYDSYSDNRPKNNTVDNKY